MEFKYFIYWIILQEDINFPPPRKMGIRMPLIRYIEGAIAAVHPKLLSLAQVFNRTNVRNRRPDPAFRHPNLERYLADNINQIR